MRFLVTLLAVGLGFTDTTPPSVSVTNPSGGAVGDWSPTLSAEASDDSGVSQVEFFVDGVAVGTDTASPYMVTWDTTGVASGTHTVTAVATDVYGNTAISSPATLTFDLAPPTVALTSPTAGATLSGIIPLRVDTTDDVGVLGVSYYWDGKWLASLSTPPFSLDWDSGAEADGPHTLTAQAHDALASLRDPVTSTVTVNIWQPVSAVYDSRLDVPLCATLTNLCDTTYRITGVDYWEPHAPNTLWSSCRDIATYNGNESRIDRLKVSTVSGAPFGTGERVRIDVHAHFSSPRLFKVDLFTATDPDHPEWTWLTTFQPDSDWPDARVFSAEYVLPTGKLQAVRAQLRQSSNPLEPCAPSGQADRDDVAFAVDSAPAVTLTSPQGTKLKGVVSLAATVDALHPVTKVEFYDGATLVGISTSAPHTLSWDTASAADGAHSLRAKAYDTAGRDGTSSPIAVTIDNHPPVVALTSPTQGESLRGQLVLVATATDAVSAFLPRLEFYDGTTLLGASTNGTYRWSWDSRSVADGPHTLTVKGYDHLGNVGTSTAVEVSVDNTAPTVTLANPPTQGNAYVSGLLQLGATASDNLGVARVEFFRDQTLLGTDTGAPYGLSWDSTSVADGSYAFFAKAYDAASNVTSSGWRVTVDNTPPSVALTSPTQGAFLQGPVTLQASASDNGELSLLEFYDGATLLGTAYSWSTQLTWNTVGEADGLHSLTVKAHDKAGNVRTSAAVDVILDNTVPAVALSAPAEYAWQRGTVQVSATASDNLAVTRVELYAGSTLLGTATTAPYTVSWDTTGVADGEVKLTARAYDAAGNVTLSAGRTVEVDNTAPTVALTAPANGASFSVLSLSTQVKASASDNMGVIQVVFYDGATVLGTDTSAPYGVSWNLLSAAKGTHTLTARAQDAAGNITLSAPISVTVK